MKLAIASGKGGTGKTTLAVALAQTAARRESVWLLDCDVEEPNAHLFLDLPALAVEPVTVRTPSVEAAACNGCGLCAELCQFNALARIKSGVMVFPELCHSCGGCALACPRGAITETDREIGVVRRGAKGNLAFAEGRIHVGEAIGTPAIRAVKRPGREAPLSIRDCPPGTACPMVEAVRGADFVLLVTEPTPFGLHDLRLAVETVRRLAIPFGVVVNRAAAAETCIRDYCATARIDLLLEIPDDRRVAERYSRGGNLLDALPEFGRQLDALLDDLRARVAASPLDKAIDP